MYGVVPQGFSRKPLNVIHDEIKARVITAMGPTIVQTPQSPMGQINGVFADLVTTLWEFAEEVYQSYDPDQSEGVPLERLGRIRLLERGLNESDESLRQAITNAGRARIDLQDLVRAVRGIAGVTYTQVWINDTSEMDANGISSHSVAVSVMGGDDDEIAATLREYIAPGIGTHGNTRVDTTIEGFCRSIWILRPTLTNVWLRMIARTSKDVNGCPPPAPAVIRVGMAQALDLLNGDDVTLHRLRAAAASLYGQTVEIIDGSAGFTELTLLPLPLVIPFTQIAAFDPERIELVMTD